MEYYYDDGLADTRRQTHLIVTALIWILRAFLWLAVNLPFTVATYFLLHNRLPASMDKVYQLVIAIMVMLTLIFLFRMLVRWINLLRAATNRWWLLVWLIAFNIGVTADVLIVQSLLSFWHVANLVSWTIACIAGMVAFRQHKL